VCVHNSLKATHVTKCGTGKIIELNCMKIIPAFAMLICAYIKLDMLENTYAEASLKPG
jgi:hypothetical protein